MKQSKLTFLILSGLVGGALIGYAFPSFAVSLKPLSDMFLRLIKMIIAPLLFSTLVVGIAGHENFKQLGKIGLKAILYFEVATTIALAIGLAVANYFQVGHGMTLDVSAASLQEISKFADIKTSNSFVDSLVHMIPTSVFDAMARGDILQIVIFALFFSLGLAAVGDKGKPVLTFLVSLSEVMFRFTKYVMFFAPIGVFAAMASAIGKNGIGLLSVYLKLIGCLYLALAIFVILVLVVVCKIIRVPFWGLLKTIRDPALLAFSTASSEAALPKAMEVMEKFGVPRNIVGFVMPTGYTFNLDGTTLYLSLATIFVAQMAHVDLPLSQQIMIMLTLMLTSKGIAGVPRVSLVILTGTLISFKLPVEGVAVLLGIDQILDMGRTTVNLIGNCVATTVIARWERCFDDRKMLRYLKGPQQN